ncbi:hypothetical protein B0H13DRAFT_1892087 [Mycena leptocephala]|nr:hypothetical protein B0H13DRAFT_1892087 [Mycena leptocephala]
MARFAVLFCAVVTAATSATAATVQERDSALITLFTDINYGDEALTVIDTVPTGCIAAIPPFVSSVSSVKIATGVKCTLWNETECGRAPGKSITLAADTPDLVKLQFNDLVCAGLGRRERADDQAGSFRWPPTSASPTIESRFRGATSTSRTPGQLDSRKMELSAFGLRARPTKRELAQTNLHTISPQGKTPVRMVRCHSGQIMSFSGYCANPPLKRDPLISEDLGIYSTSHCREVSTETGATVTVVSPAAIFEARLYYLPSGVWRLKY